METWARFGGDVTSIKYKNEKENILATLKSYDQIDKRRTFILLCSPEKIQEILSVVSIWYTK